jgi:hypothetical protein
MGLFIGLGRSLQFRGNDLVEIEHTRPENVERSEPALQIQLFPFGPLCRQPRFITNV